MPHITPFAAPDLPRQDDLVRCVHCGLCLDQCPTYRLLGLETESPRGRLHLIRAAAEGQIGLGDAFVDHISHCLQCRACEAACPSGVHFGRLIESARTQIVRQRPGSPAARLLRAFVFAHLFPYPGRLATTARLLRLYQRSGLQWLVRKTGLLRLLPGGLAEKETLLPVLAARFYRPPRGGLVPAEGERHQRVAFFTGCVGSLVFGPVNEATVRVLARNGCEVVVPHQQGCCGALHVHAGEPEIARAMARRNIAAFESSGAGVIVANAAGCGAMLKEYADLLRDDPSYAGRAARFSALVRDVSEFLATIPLCTTFGPLPRRATYQDACHLAHVQQVRQQPRSLLRAIPGLELIELPDADQCCGGAGIYNVTQRDLSMRILDQKIAHIAATGADTVITANPGCHLQLQYGLRRAGIKAEVLHVVQILDAAYHAADLARP